MMSFIFISSQFWWLKDAHSRVRFARGKKIFRGRKVLRHARQVWSSQTPLKSSSKGRCILSEEDTVQNTDPHSNLSLHYLQRSAEFFVLRSGVFQLSFAPPVTENRDMPLGKKQYYFAKLIILLFEQFSI